MPSTSSHRGQLAQWDAVLAPYSLGYRVKLLSQVIGRKFQDQLEPFGLTSFHWVVLCCLWEEDGLATSSIGERLQQVGGTLTGVLDRMEERSLVRRERDNRDRRIWRIWLTDAGKQLETILPPIAISIREQAMQGMTTAERELFSKLIDQAIANLN
jgi:DNA-binding MarR family transcriptional regulator